MSDPTPALRCALLAASGRMARLPLLSPTLASHIYSPHRMLLTRSTGRLYHTSSTSCYASQRSLDTPTLYLLLSPSAHVCVSAPFTLSSYIGQIDIIYI